MFSFKKLFKPSLYDLHRKKKFAKRKVFWAISFFAVLTLASAGYAYRSGWFVFRGVVARTQNISIEFVNAGLIGLPRAGESVTVSAADDYRLINLSVQLMMPGDSRAIQFQIANTGNQAVRLLNLSTTQDDQITTGLDVQWPDEIPESPNLTNYVLTPGSISDVFLIFIYWDAAATDVPAGQFRYFSLTMNYQNAMLPIAMNSDPIILPSSRRFLA